MYKSSVQYRAFKEDGSYRYKSGDKLYDFIVIIDNDYDYFTYRYETFYSMAGMPHIHYDHADEMLYKLSIYVNWAKLPYEMRLMKMQEVQNLLPNNDPNNPNGKNSTTDFILFHDINHNPYLTFIRPTSSNIDEYVSIDINSAIKMMMEIMRFKELRLQYEKEQNKDFKYE